MKMGQRTVTAILVVVLAAPLYAESAPYQDDPEIVEKLKALGEGECTLLPPIRHMLDGKAIKGEGREGPYARDYTNKMVYAPERQTALYSGGNHGAGRTNDVWEYHLGSNTWHCLFAAEGGDHAKYKFALMFAPRLFAKDPNPKMNETQQKNWEECAEWWKKHVVLHEGNFVTKERHGPLLVGHTWDTLVYDPVKKRMIHGTGAHCANNVFLHHKFTGEDTEAIKAKFGTDPAGKPYRTMWTFDPAARQWIPYAHESELAKLRGMGASMTWIPDWNKVVFYVAAANVSPNAYAMRTYDPEKDAWEELTPNGGKSISELAGKQKIAPTSEAQMAYGSAHKKLVAVLGKDTFAYDIEKNEWAKLNSDVPFHAHDAKTVFAYDAAAVVFLLADPKNDKLAAFDLKANKWEVLAPKGPGIPKPPYCIGKGYYDPTHNVLVVQPAYKAQMWVYRHKKAAE